MNIQSNTQTSCRTLSSSSSTPQHPPDEINVKASKLMDQIQSDGSHVQSSTAGSLNPSQKMDTQRSITNVDDDGNDVDIDKNQALIVKKNEETDNGADDSQWAMTDKKEMGIFDEKAITILIESDDSNVLESIHSSLPQRNEERPSSLSSNNFKCSTIGKRDTSMECDNNVEPQASVKTECSSYSQQKPSLSSSSVFSEQKGERVDITLSSTRAKEENGITIQDIDNVKEKVTEQHDCPVSKPSPNNHLDCFMITSTDTERKPLHDSQSSQNILDNDPAPPREKGKGKAVCKSLSPSPYISSSFGKDYHQIFSATDDENYMPKKRIISASMKNKLSLSRSKRQKASNNSSFT